MGSLRSDLVATDQHTLPQLVELANRSLQEVGIEAAGHKVARGADLDHYWLLSLPGEHASARVRPVNSLLFVSESAKFVRMADVLIALLRHVREKRGDNIAQAKWSQFIGENGISRTLYTIQQSISIALDVYLGDNRAKKRAGQYFEDLFSSLMDELGVAQKRVNFRLPIPESTDLTFNIEVDRVVNPRGPVRSTPTKIDLDDLLVSLKNSSKDRYSKLLTDLAIATRLSTSPPKLVAVFHNDVQRKEDDGVSVTFLASQYIVYTTYLGRPSGVYYVDPPGHIHRPPWSETMKPIDALLLKDLWTL